LGERIRIYRATGGRAGLLPEADADDGEPAARPSPDDDARDYDVEYYVRLLKDSFAARLARGLAPEDFATVFADPDQPSLFTPSLADARPVLNVVRAPRGPEFGEEQDPQVVGAPPISP
jgi:hypothetical protein